MAAVTPVLTKNDAIVMFPLQVSKCPCGKQAGF